MGWPRHWKYLVGLAAMQTVFCILIFSLVKSGNAGGSASLPSDGENDVAVAPLDIPESKIFFVTSRSSLPQGRSDVDERIDGLEADTTTTTTATDNLAPEKVQRLPVADRTSRKDHPAPEGGGLDMDSSKLFLKSDKDVKAYMKNFYKHDYNQGVVVKKRRNKTLQMRGTKFILNNPFMCKYGEKEETKNGSAPYPVLLIMVQSRRGNFLQRNIIRNTFATVTQYKKWDIRVIFLVGRGPGPKSDVEDHQYRHIRLGWEFDSHMDIISGPFKDNPDEFSLSSVYQHLMGIRWALRYCSRALYVVKINDDNFVDPFEIINSGIKKMRKTNSSFLCTVRRQSESGVDLPPVTTKLVPPENVAVTISTVPPADDNYDDIDPTTTTRSRPKRKPKPKPVSPTKNDAGIEYCSGEAYLTTPDALKKLFLMVSRTPFLEGDHDDFYITGKLRKAYLTTTNNTNPDDLRFFHMDHLKHDPSTMCSYDNRIYPEEFKTMLFHKMADKARIVNTAWCLWKNILDENGKMSRPQNRRFMLTSMAI